MARAAPRGSIVPPVLSVFGVTRFSTTIKAAASPPRPAAGGRKRPSSPARIRTGIAASMEPSSDARELPPGPLSLSARQLVVQPLVLQPPSLRRLTLARSLPRVSRPLSTASRTAILQSLYPPAHRAHSRLAYIARLEPTPGHTSESTYATHSAARFARSITATASSGIRRRQEDRCAASCRSVCRLLLTPSPTSADGAGQAGCARTARGNPSDDAEALSGRRRACPQRARRRGGNRKSRSPSARRMALQRRLRPARRDVSGSHARGRRFETRRAHHTEALHCVASSRCGRPVDLSSTRLERGLRPNFGTKLAVLRGHQRTISVAGSPSV